VGTARSCRLKKDIHPEYRQVVFRDVSCNFQFITRTCAASRETITLDGVEYPLIPIDISSESHPFYTGTQKLMDTEGRVERFRKKYGFQGAQE
jgi:large subunit ribosomal protein L31